MNNHGFVFKYNNHVPSVLLKDLMKNWFFLSSGPLIGGHKSIGLV